MTTPNRWQLGNNFSLSNLMVNGKEITIKNTSYTSGGVDTYGEDDGERKSRITLRSNEELKNVLAVGDQVYIESKTDVLDVYKNKNFNGKLVIYNGEVTGVGEHVEIELFKKESTGTTWELVVYDQAI